LEAAAVSEAIKREILAGLDNLPAIADAHEHLGPEKERLGLEPDVCFLFSHYLTGALAAAGFELGDGRPLSRGQVREFLLNTSLPVEQRFAVLQRFLPAVQDTAYAQALWRSLRELYGVERLGRDNFMAVTEAMRAANQPGVYDDLLARRCKIKYALTQCGHTELDKDFLVPVLNFALLTDFPEGRATVEQRAGRLGLQVKTLADYLDYCRAQLVHWRDCERVVGMKTVTQPYQDPPSDEEAARWFAKLMDEGRLEGTAAAGLGLYLRDQLCALCGAADLTVAVHAGVWDDFRRLDPRHNIPLVLRHPHTRFDLYHMGMPWVRDTIFMAGNWHNVYVNWCWSHIVSWYMAQAVIPEFADYVPASKIVAFGGDYSSPAVEKVYGHLSMAKENVAAGLARMVADRRVTVARALELGQAWFYDNPVRLYRLDRLAAAKPT
jgi:predicted TIM-barrel fold metal-dependent hydrolase